MRTRSVTAVSLSLLGIRMLMATAPAVLAQSGAVPWAGPSPVGSAGQVGSRCTSEGVLSARGRHHPRVFARLPDREVRRWKTRVGERTDRHRQNVGRRTEHVVQGRAALGTEVV